MDRRPGMLARPCDEHNTWTDFPGPECRCTRCGWHEKMVEVYMLEWMIDGKRPPPRLRLAVPTTSEKDPR